MIKYDYRPGMPFLKEFEGGRMLPQVFCAPVGELAPPMPMFTDDIIFAKEKRCLFQLVVLLTSLAEISVLKADLVNVDNLSEGELSADEATFILHDFSHLSKPAGDSHTLAPSALTPAMSRYITRVITGGEYEGATWYHSDYAIHRPPPLYYNHERLRNDIGRDQVFVILRPDRFVFAACRDRAELEKAAGLMRDVLEGGGEGSGEEGKGEVE